MDFVFIENKSIRMSVPPLVKSSIILCKFPYHRRSFGSASQPIAEFRRANRPHGRLRCFVVVLEYGVPGAKRKPGIKAGGAFSIRIRLTHQLGAKPKLRRRGGPARGGPLRPCSSRRRRLPILRALSAQISESAPMTALQAYITAFLQGVTELFPVSSLGHAVLLPQLAGW
ncbi:MAG: hypothetical protein ACREFQ_16805, partial [Stellaceae bacterium]